MNWKRGITRVWIVLSVVWIGLAMWTIGSLPVVDDADRSRDANELADRARANHVSVLEETLDEASKGKLAPTQEHLWMASHPVDFAKLALIPPLGLLLSGIVAHWAIRGFFSSRLPKSEAKASVPSPPALVLDANGHVQLFDAAHAKSEGALPDLEKLGSAGKDRSRKIVCTGLLIGLFVMAITASWIIYDLSADGTAYLFSELAGSFFGLLLLSWVFVKNKHNKISVAAVLAMLIFVSHNSQKFSDGLDLIEARPLLKASVTPDDFARNAREHPNNRMLVYMSELMGIVASRANQLTALAASTEVVNDIPLQRMDPRQLDAYSNDLALVEQKVLGANVQIDNIFAASRDKIMVFANKFQRAYQLNQSWTGEYMSRFDSGASSAREVLNKNYAARQVRLYGYRKIVLFLSEYYGHYRVNDEGQYLFEDQMTADAYNALLKEYQLAQTAVDAADEDVAAVAQASTAKLQGAFSQ